MRFHKIYINVMSFVGFQGFEASGSKLSNLTEAEISAKIAALLSELSINKVHAVIVAATVGKKKTTTFGVETNTNTNVATMLLKAGLQRIAELQ